MKKKILLFGVLLFILIFGTLTASAETIESGTCGESLTWTLDDEGTLTISGTGAMYFGSSNSNAPWYSQRENIVNVVIEDSVTSIGNNAFRNCTGLTSVTIPDSVTSIGGSAFYKCKGLTSVTIPDSVTTIGNSAFHSCYNAEEIIIGNGVSVIEEAAFRHCQAVESITIPDNITIIEKDTFFNCRRLKDVSIPVSVTEIKENAFSSCITLIKVLYKGTTNDWDKISIESGNESLLNAYEDSNRIEGLCGKNLSWNLDESGVLTISGTGRMYNFDHDAPWEKDKLKIKKVIIENGVTRIGAHSFCGCKNLDSVIIPASVNSSGTEAFYCDNRGGNANKVYIEDIKSWCGIEFQDVRANPLIFDTKLYLNNKLVENLVIPEGVTEIGLCTFYGCSSIKAVSIPSAMTGEYGVIFDSCNNLEEINVDSNNPKFCSIDGNLFSKDGKILYQYCNGKKDTKYIIPDGVTEIGDEAFGNCSNLQYAILPDSLTSIGNSCFKGCSSLKEIKIPDGITEIRWWVFNRCKSLTNIVIPNTVTEIYDNAFNDCTSLTDVYYSGSEEEWNKTLIGENNEYLLNATIHYNSNGPTEPYVLKGDILQDGKINAKDAVKLAQYLAKWDITLTDSEMLAADVVADGKINAKDAVKLAQYLAKWDITLE